MGSDYRMLGYASAAAMYHAFQSSENAHVLGFFDFCVHDAAPHNGDLLTYLRNQDFAAFAHYYNGGGAVEDYARKLASAAQTATALLQPSTDDATNAASRIDAANSGERASQTNPAVATLRG